MCLKRHIGILISMPLTQSIEIKGASANDFEPLAKDVYPFELVDIELVTEAGYQTEEMQDKLKFEFACLEEAPLAGGTSLYGRRMWKRVTLKLTGGKKPSSLYTLLTGVLNRAITPEELKDPKAVFTDTFLNALIGKQVRLSIGQKPGEKDPSKIYNTIDAYLPVKEVYPAFDKEKSKALGEKMKAEAATPTF